MIEDPSVPNRDRYAVLDAATGAVLRYGWREFETSEAETLVRISPDTVPVGQAESNTIVDGEFAPLSDEFALPILKALRIDAVNKRTEAVVASGVVFRGEQISLSLTSQINITNAMISRGGLPYPIPWGNHDDSGRVLLAGPDDVAALYTTILGYVAMVRIQGEGIRQALRVATTKEELDAVTDPR